MSSFSRWSWCLSIVVTWSVASISPPCDAGLLSQSASKKPPNIVFIFSDDHAYQAISAYNDPRRSLIHHTLIAWVRRGCVLTDAWCRIQFADPVVRRF